MSPRNRHQSVKEVLEDRVWRAAETIRARTDSVAVDRRLWPDTEGGPACGNTWIFAQRHAANLPQMLERQFPGARVLGPIIQGLDLPVNSLPWSSRVDDIVDLAATVVVLAGNGKAPARPGAWI
jgi:hypothetical protein